MAAILRALWADEMTIEDGAALVAAIEAFVADVGPPGMQPKPEVIRTLGTALASTALAAGAQRVPQALIALMPARLRGAVLQRFQECYQVCFGAAVAGEANCRRRSPNLLPERKKKQAAVTHSILSAANIDTKENPAVVWHPIGELGTGSYGVVSLVRNEKTSLDAALKKVILALPRHRAVALRRTAVGGADWH